MDKYQVAQVQSRSLISKAEYWREYIIALNTEALSRRDFFPFRSASLWATTFAYVEWLASYFLLQDQVNVADIAKVLNNCWGWDEEIGKLFWKSGRNPTAHVGQANDFHSYYTYNGLPTSVGLNIGEWTEAVTAEWGKYHPYRAVAISPPVYMGEANLQIVTFFHQMLRDELLPVLAEKVAARVSAEVNDTAMKKIIKLNRQIPH